MSLGNRDVGLAALVCAVLCSVVVAVATPASTGAAAQVTEGALDQSGERTLAGATRYSTAVVLAERAADGDNNGVVVVSGESLVDALSAVPLAAARSSVVVLTRTAELPDVVAEFVRTHGAGGVTVVGGTSAVSIEVENALAGLAGVGVIDRFAGADRYATAVTVAREAGAPGSWCDEAGPAVLMVNGSSLIDGVLAAPIAYAMGIPVLFTRADALPAVVRDYLIEAGIARAVLIGSNAEISPAVDDELGGLGVNVARIGGATPAARSVALASAVSECGVAADEFALLDAAVPVDGVAAAALLASGLARTAPGQSQTLVPVLAVDGGLPAVVAQHLAGIGDASDDVTLYALGGTARITPQLMRDALKAARGTTSFTTDSSGPQSRDADGVERTSSSSGGGTSSGQVAQTRPPTVAPTTAPTTTGDTSANDDVAAPRALRRSSTRSPAVPRAQAPVGLEVSPSTTTTSQPTTDAPPPSTTTTSQPTTTEPPQGPEIDVPDSGPPTTAPPTSTTKPAPTTTTSQPTTEPPPMTARPPSAAPSADTFAAVHAGGTLSCALTPDDTVNCWGHLWGASVPEGTFTEITTGRWHACGIRADGTVTCWGDNPFGQLDAPAHTFTTISAGQQHTCGVRTNGRLACWGTQPRGSAPEKGTFVTVDAGYRHTCAVATDGDVVCWGNNDYGQLDVRAGSFIDVTAGNTHTCALRTDAQIVCWGNSSHGRTNAPAGTYAAVSAGYDYTCGQRSDGQLVCWGRDRTNQLDAPSGTFTTLSSGAHHACALRTDNTVACWGNNDFGQLGQHAPSEPTPPTGQSPANPSDTPGEDAPAGDTPAEIEDGPDPTIDTASG